MSLSTEESTRVLKRIVIVAIFAAVAVVLSIVESIIPVNLQIPGAKLGLANIMILTCLYFLRGRDALMLVILKTIITAFIFGTFSSMLFSLFGSLFSFIVMFAVMKLGRNQVSLIGVSVIGGVAHNFGQITAASIVFQTTNIYYYLPLLLLTGLITGILVGMAVKYLVPSLTKLSLFDEFQNQGQATNSPLENTVEPITSDNRITTAIHGVGHPILELQDVTYGYDKGQPVVNGISLNISQGQWVSIVGANGSGKSTLVKLLNALLPKKDGIIRVKGLELQSDTVGDIRKMIGMVFQNPDNQFVGTTVEDDIVFGLEAQCLPIEVMEERVKTYAAKLGISELLHKHPSELSGGQKQRVAIASILSMEPEIVIFDEASSMLDEKTRNDLMMILSDMHQSGRYTIISITHDAQEIAATGRALVLHQGKLIADITPTELFQNESMLEMCHLAAPFAFRLRNDLQRYGVEISVPNSEEELIETLWPLHSNK
ncbi:Gx transporter family protein [Paenibacillus sp. CMAA1364]